MVYDATSKTAFTGRSRRTSKPRRPSASRDARRRPARARQARRAVDAVRRHAEHRPPAGRATPSGSRPRTTAGCSARPSWPGTPSAACRCAPPSTPRAREDPVLELEATDISYGAIAAVQDRHHAARGREGDRAQPADRRRRPGQADARRRASRTSQKRLDFQLAAPGRARRPAAPQRAARASSATQKGALQRYGEGLGADPRLPAAARSRAKAARRGGLTLPQVNIDGATGHRARHRARHAA